MDSWKAGFVKGIKQVVMVLSFELLVKKDCVAKILLAI